jgi:hypothetical protein
MSTLLLAVIVGPRTIGLNSLAAPHWWPLAVLGMVQAIRTISLRSSLRCVISGGSLISALACLAHGNWFTSHHGAIAGHLLLAMLLFAGFAFNDRFAQILRRINPLAILLPAMIVAVAGDRFGMGELLRVVYVACAAGVTCGCWLATRDRLWQLAAVVNAASTVIATTVWLHTGVQHVIPPRALAALAGGILCFVIATLISALKGGLGKQLWRWFDEAWRPLPPKFEEDGSV